MWCRLATRSFHAMRDYINYCNYDRIKSRLRGSSPVRHKTHLKDHQRNLSNVSRVGLIISLLVAGFVSIDLAIIDRELQSPGNRKKVVFESYGWLC